MVAPPPAEANGMRGQIPEWARKLCNTTFDWPWRGLDLQRDPSENLRAPGSDRW
jgi:hypothetical protein